MTTIQMPVDGGWDFHAHHIPANVVQAAKDGRFGLSVSDKKLIAPSYAVPVSPIGRIADLDSFVQSNGLEGAFVSPPPPLFLTALASGERNTWTRLVNEGLQEACQSSNLHPLAMLPMEDPEVAAGIAGRLDPTLSGVSISTDLAGRSFADDEYQPVWESLEASGVFVFLHPGACPDPRLDSFYLNNLLGNPYETALAVGQLLFGAVLERYTDLRFVLAHGGGATAIVVGRWQRAFELHRPGVPDLKSSPKDAIRSLFVDSIVHSTASLDHVAEVFGRDRIVYGSDWPFPLGGTVDELAIHLGPTKTMEVLTANPKPLLKPSIVPHRRVDKAGKAR